MKRSLAIWAIVYSLGSAVLWWLVGQLMPIAVPMMMNDHPALLRVSLILLALVVLYAVASIAFFRALARTMER
ncbi:hypothetical protein HMF7854_06620 [Sphingomonas ginkgonis]|uniref:Uncharacterized protein n=1 Tax=Sphingomonas ginkgonis TaxID=2315330 RepID=A0A3R9Y5H9_9SPHN|nr:hypothetical protein [Sphingomonas ginkgonis]RST30541.1 hypothetical protein HMF7854_06620 [Sphingomonas ginkgonis]